MRRAQPDGHAHAHVVAQLIQLSRCPSPMRSNEACPHLLPFWWLVRQVRRLGAPEPCYLSKAFAACTKALERRSHARVAGCCRWPGTRRKGWPMSTLRASRLRSRVAIAAAVTGVAALGASAYTQRLRAGNDARPPAARLQLPPTLVEAIAGAMGEVSQIIALYPLDTIKVRCQSMGQPSAEVIRGLLSQGVNRRLIRKLYAGAWGAALCSVLVGAVHFASFETCRRLLLQNVLTGPAAVGGGEGKGGPDRSTGAGPSGRASAPLAGEGRAPGAKGAAGVASVGGVGRAGAVATGVSSGDSASGLALIASSAASMDPGGTGGATATAAALGPGAGSAPATRALDAGAAAAAAGSAALGDTASPAAQGTATPQGARQSQDRWVANVLAAAFAALVTAVVESPVELFRHNQQAGLVKGDFMREMAAVVRRDGPSGLYWGFLPHCFEAWPHDISELWVYGSMKDLARDASQPGSGHPAWLGSLPVHAWDLSTGAAAGAAAVLISMPFDCIKTYMQTHGTDLTGKGMRGSAKLFVKTGVRMVRRSGVGALYYGVAPRLLQQVPSSTVGWYVIHAVQRFLEPYTAGSEASADGGHAGVGVGASHSS